MKITLKTVFSLLPAYIVIAFLLAASVFAVNREHLFQAKNTKPASPFAAARPNLVFAAEQSEEKTLPVFQPETTPQPVSHPTPNPAAVSPSQYRNVTTQTEYAGNENSGAGKGESKTPSTSTETPAAQKKETAAAIKDH